jgi:hypothetical protein
LDLRDAWIENNIVIPDENVTQDGKFNFRITKTSITGASVLFKDERVNWNTIQGWIELILGIKHEEI